MWHLCKLSCCTLLSRTSMRGADNGHVTFSANATKDKCFLKGEHGGFSCGVRQEAQRWLLMGVSRTPKYVGDKLMNNLRCIELAITYMRRDKTMYVLAIADLDAVSLTVKSSLTSASQPKHATFFIRFL